MIVRPTTAQLLRDVRHELTEVVGPEVHGATAKVALEQIDIILEQCAVRADSEIAWMIEEIDEIEAYAADVADDVEGINEAEVISRLQANQVVLQASFQTLSQIQGLSLVNFIN